MSISVGDASGRSDNGPEKRRDAFIDGTWWPADREDLQVAGKVSAFGEGSVWLDTDADDDFWNATSGADGMSPLDTRVLFGCAAGGTPMCLHGVRLTGAQREFSGRTRARYVADRLIFGAAVRREEDVRLAFVRVTFRGLREWLMGRTSDTSTPLRLVRPEQTSSDEADVGAGVETWGRSLVVEIDGVQVHAIVSKNLATSGRFRAVYDTSAWLQLESEDWLTLAEWRHLWIEPVRDLVLFGTREQTVTLSFRGFTSSAEGSADISVYDTPEVAIQRAQHSEYHQRDLLPAGIWDEDGFQELIANWRGLHSALGAVAQAFFELLNTADIAPLTRLLRLTSCAEGYHRALHDEPPFSEEQHNAMVAAMVEALPDDSDIRAHYEGRLTHANSQSQRRRIRWLVERAATADARLEGQAARLTNRLVGWRNDHTHLETEISTPPLDDLLLLNAVLTYVLEANILLDLGIHENTRYCLAQGHAWDDPIPTFLASFPSR